MQDAYEQPNYSMSLRTAVDCLPKRLHDFAVLDQRRTWNLDARTSGAARSELYELELSLLRRL